MRAVLWFLALFGIASAVALFAGNNQGTITVFWPPWRVDLSLNLVLLILLGTFVLLHLALRGLSALFSLPRQARQWRLQQKERALHAALLDALAQLLAGRFSRSRKAAQAALAQERTIAALDAHLPQAQQIRVLSHLLAAESAQALQDRAARDAHLQQALTESAGRSALPGSETREGVQLRAARWALDDRDAPAALARLEELPLGAQRRTLALRLRLKAARQDRRTLEALETARLLAKHRAFSESAAQSIVRGLATELLSGAHDPAQLLRAWSELETPEREMPEVAIHAAQRMVVLRGDLILARAWLLPVWERMVEHANGLGEAWRVKLVRALEAGLESIDAEWLARIESAQRNNPRDPNLQYLAGMACMKRQLWGKAQQLLTQAGLGLQDANLHRRAWQALAQLAEARDDADQASAAWKRAAQTESP
ncbi:MULTISPECIES: heme biosynthesis HemY N-terminal domain-containing protein [unclassified Variovorax]|uniref:heme biosynthesis HemY N-terminal domain-containing protein n=1 Tax=unclassified Variovorax TaxID=663243 RepID=UPI001317006A|nr:MULTISPECIES: heme biosynthesis HemY N-terminal domain-containing protein [unclassified Variovorax]VTU27469.1 heme biosynthesis-associated TPR protein [Variovorax sp. SRS16]VTU35245.1 heme biosynthesis-associated TPR protein [Variovorax sp. PBL-E5]